MLTARQHQALLEVVGEANGVADLAEFRRGVLPGVRRLVPADYASYNEVADDGTALATIADPEIAAEHHETWGRLAAQNPLLQRFQRTRDGRPYRFSDVVSRQELEALEIYRELYAPLGIEHQICLALPSPPDVTIAIVLSRGGADFTDAEVEALALLRPHLIQAYRNARRAPTPEALARLGLTPAEGRVLAAFAHGRSTDEAAADLGISPRTVLKHGERIHRKLGVRDRAQAVAAAWTASTR